ncbi:MAG: sigma-70 family RNA polymerase sigma factor [Planctomycetota bacterium]|nr:sigma-70 family RNA polymerase sigma factor [Planctomycetota bacterium]
MTEAKRQDARRAAKKANARGSLTPEMLVREHASAVLGLCIAYAKDFHDGEDIMQDVFLKAFTRIGTLRDHTRARQWLLKIARRMCIDHYRKRRPCHPIADAEALPARADSGDEQTTRVHAAVSKLPDGYRETISLYYLDGCDCAGVARSLGISNAAVRRRLVRARLMLHELLVEDKS